MDFYGQELAMGCGTVARAKRTETALVMWACAPTRKRWSQCLTWHHHASMRDALQAVRKTHEVFGQISEAQLRVTANRVGERWRLMCKARVRFCQDACRDRRCCCEEHSCAHQAASQRRKGTRVHELQAESWRQLRKQ